jgi:hypothetical protein
MQISDAFQQIRFPLTVVSYDHHTLWRQRQRDMCEVTEIPQLYSQESSVAHRDLKTTGA